MEDLLLLNNQGVHLLQQKDTEGAISKFTRAMYVASEFLPHDFGYPAGREELDDFPVTCVPLGETPIAQEALTNNGNHTSQFDVYDKAFVFTTLDCSHALVDAVLLYNVGICYHRLAVTAASNKDESLKNELAALRCYKCGLNLIRHADKPSGEPLFHLALATLCNLAHVFWCCNRPKEARHCTDMLDALMESYIPDYLSQEDAEFFVFGKFHRTLAMSVHAAAA